MKKIIASTVLVAGMLTTSAMADVKVGLGVDVMNTYTNPVGSLNGGSFGGIIGSTPVIRVPVDMGAYRIEPRIAYISASSDYVAGGTQDDSLMAFGVGAYYKLANSENSNIYVGGQADYFMVGKETTPVVGASVTTDINALAFAAVVGAEFFMTPNFSLASELGLQYTSTTVVDGTFTTTGAKADVVGTDIAPVTSVTFRYYF